MLCLICQTGQEFCTGIHIKGKITGNNFILKVNINHCRYFVAHTQVVYIIIILVAIMVCLHDLATDLPSLHLPQPLLLTITPT